MKTKKCRLNAFANGVEQDKLQCPWDGVNNIQTRFNAMLTKAMQKNELPSDVAQYDRRIINSNYNVLQE